MLLGSVLSLITLFDNEIISKNKLITLLIWIGLTLVYYCYSLIKMNNIKNISLSIQGSTFEIKSGNIFESPNLKVINFEKRDRHNYVNFMKSAYTEGPEEFVRLIKNAEYVVTTSFHATVFSILFHKRFFVVPHKTTGSRVTDLIDKLHIKNRIYYTIDEFKAYTNYKEEVDYTESDKNLLEEREKSINFLEEAIDGKKEDIHE